MRLLAGLLIGLLLGFLLAVLFLRSGLDRSPPPAAVGPAMPDVRERELRSAPGRAGEEAASSPAAAREPRGDDDGPLGQGRGDEPVPSLAEREARARRTLAFLDGHPGLRDLHQRHSREERDFPRWSSAQFLSDPSINPRGSSLSDERREEFELLYTRAHQAIKAIDLQRQVAVAQAIARSVEEHLQGREPSLPPASASEEDLEVSLPDDLQITLHHARFPEIAVLRLEKEAAVIEWLLEARRFLATAR